MSSGPNPPFPFSQASHAQLEWLLCLASTFQACEHNRPNLDEGHAETPHQSTVPTLQSATEAEPFNSGLRGLIPMDPLLSQPRGQVVYAHSGAGRLWHSVIKWLNTPMGNAPVAWRRIGTTNARRPGT